MGTYYRLLMSVSERDDTAFGWSPTAPRRLDGGGTVAGQFAMGILVDPSLSWIIESAVIFTELTDFTESIDGPIVSARFAEFVQNIDPNALQRIPVPIKNVAETGYEILNVVRLIPAIEYSSIDKPINSILNLKLRTNIELNYHIFRAAEWTIPIFVSEFLKTELQKQQFTGMEFQDL